MLKSDNYSYKIDERLFYEKFYIHIYYKNMDIKWILEEFSLKEINEISKNILILTKHVEFNNISKTFLCKNKWGWRVIENALMQHYYQHKSLPMPDNLIELSLYNFASDSDKWQNFIS